MGENNFNGTIGEYRLLPQVLDIFTKDHNSGMYTVAFAGYAANLNEYHVQINRGTEGYSSDWPEWAYDLAKQALLNNKKLWVISNGIPFGCNIEQVVIYFD